jgi:hypothetical protein
MLLSNILFISEFVIKPFSVFALFPIRAKCPANSNFTVVTKPNYFQNLITVCGKFFNVMCCPFSKTVSLCSSL